MTPVYAPWDNVQMEQYLDVCPKCESHTLGISHYFCIRNRGMCENCLARTEYDDNRKYRMPKNRPKAESAVRAVS